MSTESVMRQRACCGFGPGAPSFNTSMPREHVIGADGIERLLWADGAETDICGYRSGAADSPSAIHRQVRALMAREEFLRLLDRVNAPGPDMPA